MDKRTTQKLNMYAAAVAVCDDNAAVTGTNIAFMNTLANVKSRITTLKSSAGISMNTVTGITEQKTNIKEELAEEIVEVTSLVYAYAAATGNRVLQANTDYSLSALVKKKDSELPILGLTIMKVAEPNIAAMTGYELSQAMIDRVKQKCQAYSDSIAAPRIAILERTTSNESIHEQTKGIDEVLKNQLDKLMITYKHKQPVFFAGYTSARKIIKVGVRKSRAKKEALMKGLAKAANMGKAEVAKTA